MEGQKIDFQALSVGRTTASVSYHLTKEAVSEYIEAVADGSPLYQDTDLVPPTALAALSVRTLLVSLGLPPGTVHASQDLGFKGVARTGQRITCGGRVVQNQLRGKSRFLAVEANVSGEDGEMLLWGRSLVILPEEG